MTDQSKQPAGTMEREQVAGRIRSEPKRAEQPRLFSPWQRVQIHAAAWVGNLTLAVIGRTLHWEVQGWENWESARKVGKGLIYTFWHREIFPATWFWRKRGIIVMTSQNFDGEYIARIIQSFGYRAARGSSSRGAAQALAEMMRGLRKGHDAAFTIDGPRGPRFVAKRGSVLLARASGAAILCFHIALDRTYIFEKSWDRFQIPYPFSRAAVFIAPPILVSRGANENEQAEKHQEVQATLDDLRRQGDEWIEASRHASE